VHIEIVGDAMDILSGKRNRSNLSIPVAGNVVKDKHQVAPIGHPSGLLQQGAPGVYGLLFSVSRIENHDSAEIFTARLEHRSRNGLAIDRPGGIGVSRQRKRSQDALAAAIGMANDELGIRLRRTVW